MPFTLLDILLIILALCSGFLAMMRGFSRESLSILSWVLAGIITVYAVANPDLLAFASTYITPEWLAKTVVGAGAFILTLIVVSLFTAKISQVILRSKIGVLDRSLGFAFGLLRGLLIVVVMHMIFTWLVPASEQPGWIRNARSLSLLESTGTALKGLLPSNPGETLEALKKKAQAVEEAYEKQQGNGELPITDTTTQAPGYDPESQRSLDQLIDNIQRN